MGTRSALGSTCPFDPPTCLTPSATPALCLGPTPFSGSVPHFSFCYSCHAIKDEGRTTPRYCYLSALHPMHTKLLGWHETPHATDRAFRPSLQRVHEFTHNTRHSPHHTGELQRCMHNHFTSATSVSGKRVREAGVGHNVTSDGLCQASPCGEEKCQ